MIFGILLVFVFLLTTDGGNEGEVITRSPLGRFWDCPRLPGIHKILSHLTFTKISNKRYTNTQILKCNNKNIDISTRLARIHKILSQMTLTKISNIRYTSTQILKCNKNIDILTGLPGIHKVLSHLTFTKISQSPRTLDKQQELLSLPLALLISSHFKCGPERLCYDYLVFCCGPMKFLARFMWKIFMIPLFRPHILIGEGVSS